MGTDPVASDFRVASEVGVGDPAKPAREPIACPVCDATAFDVAYEPTVLIDDPARLYGAASGVRGAQRLVRCQDCGLLFENPRYGPAAIVAGYAGSEDAGHDSQRPMRVRSFAFALRRLRKHLPPPGARVLDIGTAGGAFLEAATDFGYEAHGLEPSKYLVEQARLRGLTVDQGTIDNHTFEPASFDLICLWDVLEHLTDPKAALRKVVRLLKPDGVVLLNYPDIGTLPARLAGRRFWWLLSVHLQHFDRGSIRDICSRVGLEAFMFRRYWQILEFGYLESIAGQLGVPFAAGITRATPGSIRRIPIPYYASQTTALARLRR
jgi:SAM-dependent methyltransferase